MGSSVGEGWERGEEGGEGEGVLELKKHSDDQNPPC